MDPPHGAPALPFASLISARAAACLRRAGAELPGGLPEELADSLQPQIEQRLLDIAGRFLFREFAAVRAKGERAGTGGVRVYDDFDAALPTLTDELAARYPAGWELFEVAQADLAAAVARTVERFHRDRPALIAAGFALADEITDIRLGCSDPHAGGQTVSQVRTAGGNLFLKPRSVDNEAWWGRLLGWYSERAPVDLPAAAALARGSYGWMAAVEAAPCPSEEAQAFGRRAGALLLLAWLFGLGDLHVENVVRAGSSPVVIDCEALLSTTLDLPGASPETFSVLDTLLLPVSSVGAGDCGLFGRPSTGVATKRFVGTGDDLRLEVAPTPPPHHPVPARESVPSIREVGGAILRGFAEAADVMAASRGDAGLDELLLEARRLRTRIIVRPTGVYAGLLQRLLEPSLLRNATTRSRDVSDSLSQGLGGQLPHALLEAEQQALCRGDVPLFSVSADGVEVEADGQVLDGVAARAPGVAAAAGRHRSVGGRETERQARIAQLALALAGEDVVVPRAVVPHPVGGRPDAAVHLAEAVMSGGLLGPARGVEWLGTVSDESGATTIGRLGIGWYDGLSGAVAWLAELASVTGADHHRRVAEEGLDQLLDRTRALPPLVAAGPGLSGGLGGVLFGLAWIGVLLGDRRAIDRALELAPLSSQVGRDAGAELLDGLSGLALGLAALASATGESEVAARAVEVGEEVLDLQIVDGDDRGGWARAGGPPLAGLSHGASGCVLTLARLAPMGLDGPAVRSAMERAVAFEDRLFDARAREWIDRRERIGAPVEAVGDRKMHAWCHGAPGIALARLAAAEGCTWGDATAALHRVVTAVAGHDDAVPEVDFACCGEAGRVAARQALHVSGLLEPGAPAVAMSWLHERVIGGTLRFRVPTLAGAASPSLFTGAGGIVSTLLSDPAGAPSPLIGLVLPEERGR